MNFGIKYSLCIFRVNCLSYTTLTVMLLKMQAVWDETSSTLVSSSKGRLFWDFLTLKLKAIYSCRNGDNYLPVDMV